MSRCLLPEGAVLRVEGREIPLRAVCDDSRVLVAGDLFLLLPSAGERRTRDHALRCLRQAEGRGAAAVVSVGMAQLLSSVKTPHLALTTMDEAGVLLRSLLSRESGSVDCIGITGTDGKTSIAWMMRRAMQRMRGAAWSLGTLGWIRDDDTRLPLENTTPSLLQMHHALAEAGRGGVTALICEVSSHGVAQQRIAGMPFSAALWSNIGRDHLQDHGGFDHYCSLKARFVRRVLDGGGVAVANGDQPAVLQALPGDGARLYLYRRDGTGGGDQGAERTLFWHSVGAQRVRLSCAGEEVEIADVPEAEFHHENIAATATLLCAAGFAEFGRLPELLSGMETPPGRMERVAEGVYIDYAHTPEALAALLASARKLCRGRLLLLFGCGGDRDRSKRAQMGAVAARGADALWITEDNARSEDPGAIADDVLRGVEETVPVTVELDRRQAVFAALQAREKDDLLLIAGKGHEDYIERDGVRRAWSDAACVRSWYRARSASGQRCA